MGDHLTRFRAMIEMVSGIRGLFQLFKLKLGLIDHKITIKIDINLY